jgi:nitrate reductase cytochrome c-type subunit
MNDEGYRMKDENELHDAPPFIPHPSEDWLVSLDDDRTAILALLQGKAA